MGKGKKDKPTRKERRAQKKQVLFGGDDGLDLDTQLKKLGLTTKCITGDGNCLFRALSDQYYGYDKHHRSIRREVCDYLAQHKDNYQYFVEDDIPFDQYLSSMQQDGCFGGHMVIVGFARLRQVDVKIYQPGMIYVISGVDEEDAEEGGADRQVLHIAYHSWEHYSSIRNIDGPYNGMPEINDDIPKGSEAAEVAAMDDDDNDNGSDEDSPDSKEKVILNACPGTNIRKVRRLLRKHKGDPNKVIDALYESNHTTGANQGDESVSPTATIASTVDALEPTSMSAATIMEESDTSKDVTDGQGIQGQSTEPSSTKIPPDKDEKTSPPSPSPSPPPPPPPPLPPPKRQTARERKLMAKMRQKEQQREKKQRSADRHAANSRKRDTHKTDGDAITTIEMKQLHI